MGQALGSIFGGQAAPAGAPGANVPLFPAAQGAVGPNAGQKLARGLVKGGLQGEGKALSSQGQQQGGGQIATAGAPMAPQVDPAFFAPTNPGAFYGR